MFKKETVEKFISAANSYQYDYGTGVKNLPLLSSVPGDPPGVYTANVPLLHVPLVGDLDHIGEKFKYREVTPIAPVQDTDWADVPKDVRSEVYRSIREAGLGQGGGSFDNLADYYVATYSGSGDSRQTIPGWSPVLDSELTFKLRLSSVSGGIFDGVHSNIPGVYLDSGIINQDDPLVADIYLDGELAVSGTTAIEANRTYDVRVVFKKPSHISVLGNNIIPSAPMAGSIYDVVMKQPNGDTERLYLDKRVSSADPDSLPNPSVIREVIGGEDGQLQDVGSNMWTKLQE